MTDLAGHTLGRYRIVELIGAGGMGEVYRARDTELDRDVAVKVLPELVARHEDRLSRFQHEARVVAQLAHLNILEVWDVGSEDGQAYVVTELLEGKSLRELISGTGLGWRKAVEIGAAVADGLAAAHGKGIVHRDIKPDNIFVTSDGRVKILDFGLAKSLEQLEPAEPEAETRSMLPPETRSGTILGTVGYMSPEQVRGEPVDQRTDVFSLGCVISEMLTGRAPFVRRSAADTMAAILCEEPDDLSPAEGNVPGELERTVRRCLEKSPSSRFQSAADLAFALRSLSETRTTPDTVPRPKRRSRNVIVVLAAAVVLALLVFAAHRIRTWLGGGSSAAIRSIAVLPLENLSGDPEQDYFAMGMTEALITDLGRIGALRVISRQSVVRFKGSDTPLPEIARALDVDAIVEGAVQRVGDTVRISTQLIRANPEEHLWADSYERELTDILALQNEVARRIAREVSIRLTAREEALLTANRQIDPEAHELYLKAQYLAGASGDVHVVTNLYTKAIERDPNYAPPYAGLADKELFQVPAQEYMPIARAHALKALELDPTLADAHAVLAMVEFYFDWDWTAAEDGFLEAINLGPASATAHTRYAAYLIAMGRFADARQHLLTARRLDPLNAFVATDLARIKYYERDYGGAVAAYNEVLEQSPDFYWSLLFRGIALEQQGLYEEAAGSIVRALRVSGREETASTLERAFAAEGYDGLLRAWKAFWLANQWRAQSTTIAMISVRLGDFDEAFRWLERAFEERPRYLVNLEVEPQFDAIRSDPRFEDLLRRMHFPGH